MARYRAASESDVEAPAESWEPWLAIAIGQASWKTTTANANATDIPCSRGCIRSQY